MTRIKTHVTGHILQTIHVILLLSESAFFFDDTPGWLLVCFIHIINTIIATKLTKHLVPHNNKTRNNWLIIHLNQSKLFTLTWMFCFILFVSTSILFNYFHMYVCVISPTNNN